MYKIITFLLLSFGLGFSVNDAGEKLLGSLQDKFDKVTNLSAEFKQTSNGKASLNGKFFFKKEDKFRIELKNSTLVSDGTTNWSYNQKEHKVIMSSNNSSNASPFSLRKIVYDYPKECSIGSETIDGREILVLTPNENSEIGYSLVKIWINKENLIERIVLIDKANNNIQIDFSKYKLNQKLTDNYFNFTPPEGSKVIDLR
jgi:outer membrane lipoprotein carrier protein